MLSRRTWAKALEAHLCSLLVSSYQPKSQQHGAPLKRGNKSRTQLSEFSGIFFRRHLCQGDRVWSKMKGTISQTGRLPPGHCNFQCLLRVRSHQSRTVPCFGICPEVWSKHINLYLNRTRLPWKHTHMWSNLSVHEVRQTGGLSQRDWKKGEGRKRRSPRTLWVFLKKALDGWGGNWRLMGRNEHALLADVTGRDCS